MSKEDKYKHGMKVPEDYFDNFEERLFIRLAEEELPDAPGFSVPDGYFDTLDEKVMANLPPEGKGKVIPFYRRRAFSYMAGAAACAVLVFSLLTKGPGENMTLEIADIEAYLDAGGIDYNSYDVAQLLNEDDLESIPLENEFLSEESLEEYLLENLDDTNLLIE